MRPLRKKQPGGEDAQRDREKRYRRVSVPNIEAAIHLRLKGVVLPFPSQWSDRDFAKIMAWRHSDEGRAYEARREAEDWK